MLSTALTVFACWVGASLALGGLWCLLKMGRERRKPQAQRNGIVMGCWVRAYSARCGPKYEDGWADLWVSTGPEAAMVDAYLRAIEVSLSLPRLP